MVTNVQNDTTADSLGWISRRKSSFVRLHRWSGFSQNSSSRKVLLKYSLEEICFRIQFRSALKFLMASSFRPLFAKDKTWATEKKKSKLFFSLTKSVNGWDCPSGNFRSMDVLNRCSLSRLQYTQSSSGFIAVRHNPNFIKGTLLLLYLSYLTSLTRILQGRLERVEKNFLV